MEKIQTENAPKAVGPYSQAIKHNGLVYTAGQIPINPDTGKLVEREIIEQTIQVLKNLKAVLSAAGSSMENAIKVTVFLKNLDDYAKMNEIYSQYFTNKPARATVQVAKLPLDVLVEIDVVAKCD
ncbi:RidA family protein [archaeon]|jgi:2-iminobutanoate/2-iminopropanoate deaminase|nr:RidA family protein [archaeon]MBT6821093.1 RidA family protein [archaeon]MBT7392987.1 RidA family protein [archaeon]